MKILEGDILPGIGISDFKLGITREELLGRLGDDFCWDEQKAPIEWIGVFLDEVSFLKGVVKKPPTVPA